MEAHTQGKSSLSCTCCRQATLTISCSRGPSGPSPADRPWAHDLHETVASPKATIPSNPAGVSDNTTNKTPAAPAAAAPAVPNRTFSTTTVLGNVTVQIFLPGMTGRISVPNVVKRHHTLLPQHRPPLRRDKPVRISIPDQQPRYIFPSTERSFIFIPRALRPNQQGYARSRARGSFHVPRRASMLNYGVYSPSIAMSRKSSTGGMPMGDGMRSPVGSVLSRTRGSDLDPGKPVVRLPAAPVQPAIAPSQLAAGRENVASTSTSTPDLGQRTQSLQETIPRSIPMHQPRPQKTVSVADIESPTTFPVYPPQPQPEQPFHQQVSMLANMPPFNDNLMGAGSRRPSQPAIHAATPLSQIPERAVYAPPFHPYPIAPAGGYFPGPYPPGTLFIPPSMQKASCMAGPWRRR